MYMTLYSKLVNEETHEYIIKNEIEAKKDGWTQHKLIQGWNGKFYDDVKYIPIKPQKTIEEIKDIRNRQYVIYVDNLVSELYRKELFGLLEEGEKESLMKKIEQEVARIKEENPYPSL